MRVCKLQEHIFLIDLETIGLENFIASYVLKGEYAAIIETGPRSSIPNLLSGLDELGIRGDEVKFVAVSHVHLDHAGGVGSLIKHLPNAEVIVHQRGFPHLVDPSKLWQQSRVVLGEIAEMYGEPEPVPRERFDRASNGSRFDLGNGVGFKVIETIGHASHHQSYVELESQGLFPGDAAGIYIRQLDVVVPTTPAPFRLDSALEALEKLKRLGPKILYYSHFGSAGDSAKRLQAYEDQLSLWVQIASRGLAEGKSQDEIGMEILEEDPAMRKARGLIESHPIMKETVLFNSVQGVTEFANRSYASC